MRNTNIVLFHQTQNLNHIFRIVDLPIRQQNHIPKVVLHLLIFLNDVEQWHANFCSSEVGIEGLNFGYCFLNVFIVVEETLRVHSLEVTAETDNIVLRIFRQRFQKKD